MRSTVIDLMRQLWQDDEGSVIATEYLILGSIVALGSTVGLVSMRDATVVEMQEYGNSVRAVRQSYQVSGQQSPLASKSGSAATDSCPTGPASSGAAPSAAQNVLFSVR